MNTTIKLYEHYITYELYHTQYNDKIVNHYAMDSDECELVVKTFYPKAINFGLEDIKTVFYINK